MRVAIQGVEGSFHQIAAFKFFGEREIIESVECETFREFFRTFERSDDYFGVMAIENTVAGTILPNYALLRNSPLQIIGEVYLRIKHNLLALNGQGIMEIKEVHSHPMALLQCHAFFEKYPHLRMVESADTALSARLLKEGKSKGVAAIAANLAADKYGLSILAEGIETNKRNFTRFLVLQHSDMVPPAKRMPTKASVCFDLAHESGSLARVLQIFAEHGINLTKIQSLPVIGKEWRYFFHLDLEFDAYDNYQKSLQNIRPYVQQLKILGEYLSGIKHRTI